MLLRVAILALGLSPSGTLAADAMRPNDIKTMFFNGQPFIAATPGGIKFKMTFMPDGKALREPLSSAVVLQSLAPGDSAPPAFAQVGTARNRAASHWCPWPIIDGRSKGLLQQSA